MRFLPIIAMLLVLLAAGCVTQEQQPITDIMLQGHGEQIYQFSYDVRESVKIPSNDEAGIRSLVRSSDRLTFVFNSTASGEDKSMFQQAIFNLANKIPTYFAYEGVIMRLDVIYYGEDGYLYNATKERTEMPSNPKVILLSPTTGATGTSVNLDEDTITLQGMDRKGIVLAGDKLALIVMDIGEATVGQYALR